MEPIHETYGPLIDSANIPQVIDLIEEEEGVEDLTLDEKKQKTSFDAENPETWSFEYCKEQAIQLLKIKEETQSMISRCVESTIRNRQRRVSFQISPTLFKVNPKIKFLFQI